MSSSQFVPALFGFTLFAVLLLGIWQWRRARYAQRHGTPAVHDQSPETTATIVERTKER